ncbi:MAG: twin-arginine translocase TatA/TatE family subunit [Novosphingobium sp.]|nr:twin-arginine translocase TatA/TatE family subunit [Novosphingobium sp.]
MSPSLPQFAIVACLIMLFFGRGKISAMMGDFGKGIASFRRGISHVDDDPRQLDHLESERLRGLD